MTNLDLEWIPKLYVVSRRDLLPGARACQGMHAIIQFNIEYPEIINHWHENSNHLVFLETEDEEALGQLCADAFEKGINFTIFHEPDLDNDLTAIVLEPTINSRELLKNFPLALKIL